VLRLGVWLVRAVVYVFRGGCRVSGGRQLPADGVVSGLLLLGDR